MPFTITREFAQKHGFKIDAFSNPNVAYKGDKNKPDEWHYIEESETRIIQLFFTEKNALEYQRTGKTYVEVDDEEGHIKGLALVSDMIKDVFFDCGNKLYMEIPKQATRFIDAAKLFKLEQNDLKNCVGYMTTSKLPNCKCTFDFSERKKGGV